MKFVKIINVYVNPEHVSALLPGIEPVGDYMSRGWVQEYRFNPETTTILFVGGGREVVPVCMGRVAFVLANGVDIHDDESLTATPTPGAERPERA